jgi:hypothetical protein
MARGECMDREYLASHTEAFLRNGSTTTPLPDMLARIMWQEGADSAQQDLATIKEQLVLAVSDYAVLHRKNVDLERLCRGIEIKEQNGRVAFSLPAEVIGWLATL